MKPKNIKRQWMIWAVTLLLLSAAMALPTLWPRLFPSHYVSDLYRRYEHNPHIHTTEIHNFHVNDTLSVDALLFQADTDSAWYTLLADFGSPEEIIELYKSDKETFVGKGHHTIIFFFIDKNNPQKRLPRNDPDSRLVIGSHEKKSLLLFLAEDKTIKDAIGLGEVHKLNKKKINKHPNPTDEKTIQIRSSPRSARLGRHRLPERK